MVFAVLLYVGLIALSGFGVLWGIGSILVGFDRYEEEHAIRTTPLASLDSVAAGPTAVQGRVEPVGRQIGSLYDCEACVAYELTVEDTGSDSSETHVDRSAAVPFDIATDDGSIRIRDADFDFHVSEDRRWSEKRKSHTAPEDRLARFEREWQIPELRTGDDRLYSAAYVEPGDEVYVYGTAELDDTLSEEQSKPLVLTDRDGLFFISDRSPDELLRDRRFALAKNGLIGVAVAVTSLTVFLWMTGIAQIFLGA